MINGEPLRDHIAAISCGIFNGTPVLDLDYAEDSEADTDANFVMTGSGNIVEVQGTAEKTPFSEEQLLTLLGLARKGVGKLVDLHKDGGDVTARPTTQMETATAHRPISGRLVIATHNPGKLAEMRELLSIYGIAAVSAGELGLPRARETGTTFRANARIKAEGRGARLRDGGLRGRFGAGGRCSRRRAGIHSARWAGQAKDFAGAMARIDALLRERGAVTRTVARRNFVSALCVAWPDGHVEEFEATVDGTLVYSAARPQGFGYDPMFLPDGLALTFGEMTSDEKHGLPPRGRACRTAPRAFLRLAEACLERR